MSMLSIIRKTLHWRKSMVTPNQVSDVLKAKGFDVDRRKIVFKVQPKELGEYIATLDLHKEVKHEVKVVVVAD